MSHTTLLADPGRRAPAGSRNAPRSAPAAQSDLLALTRALVFTKEAYRTLRAKDVPRRPIPVADQPAPSLHVVTAGQSFRAEAATAAAKPSADRPLTPWDLIDDHDADEGVTFDRFQRRPAMRLVQDAA